MDGLMRFVVIFLVFVNFSGAFVVKKRTDPSSSEDLFLERVIYPEENIGVTDIDIIEGDIKYSRRRNAVKDHNSLWTTRIIPFEINPNTFTPSDVTQIQNAIREIETRTCVRFKLRHNEPDYIIFQIRDSCTSDIGRMGGPQTIDLHFSCMMKGYIIHEIMHAMGFWHEHARPDRDDYVEVMWGNILDGLEYNFEKKDPSEVIFPGAYDYGSIMHYKTNNFAKDRSQPTLKPLQSTNAWIGQRIGLSPLDAWKINTVYKCNNTACPHPGTPAHGILLATDLSIGQNVSYHCKPGYTLIGGAMRFCQDIEKWTGSLPECIGGVLHYCNFDHPDLCGWTQSKNDMLDWTWNSGGTKTKDTGPVSDHTFSHGSVGHYLYLETSSPFVTGDSARVMSPSILAPNVPICLRYFYSMFGKGMGTMNIYYLQKNTIQMIKTISGNHGEGWKEDKILLNVRPKSEFQIIFEGVKGANWTSDMAIDDIIVGDCSLISLPSAYDSTQSNGPGTRYIGTCNFNEGSCGFRQDTTDNFDWELRTGGTTTDSAICDRDDCQNGKYLHIDTSKHHAATVARIISPMYRTQNAGTKCISFYYLIQGSDLGGLALYVIEGTGNPYEVWSQVADSTKNWALAMVEVRPSVKFMIMFEGEIRKGYIGDLAIDDIKILDGPCPYKATVMPIPKPGIDEMDCNFDTNGCGWTYPLGSQNAWIRNSGNTATPKTGPPYDHTTGNGHYIYIESSFKTPGTAYTLVSPTVPTNTEGYCFSLWYNMEGTDVGTLRIIIKISGMDDAVIWEKVGEQGKGWKQGSVFIPGVKYDYKLAIIGLVGSGKLGDIAVDDVTIHPGPCPVQSTSTSSTSTNRNLKNDIATSLKKRTGRRRGKNKKSKRWRSRRRSSSYNLRLQNYLRTYW
ncbi:MAM and LDL-receptor class A domain-containing protein 1-like [Lineus longissimus]|uniref:MAM and LDL-receptor class A domain-containing protein 1-like n=1 Tax=Lineus longissimus TaxID=88925 RepID=UPI002B4F6704